MHTQLMATTQMQDYRDSDFESLSEELPSNLSTLFSSDVFADLIQEIGEQ